VLIGTAEQSTSPRDDFLVAWLVSQTHLTELSASTSVLYTNGRS